MEFRDIQQIPIRTTCYLVGSILVYAQYVESAAKN